MSFDLQHNLQYQRQEALAAQTATFQSNASSDTQGFERAALVLEVGAWTDGTHAVAVEHDDDDGAGSPAGTWAAVAAEQLNGAFVSITDATQDGLFQIVEYRGGKRHIRVNVTVGSATTGATYGFFAVLGEARHAPVSQL